MNAAKPISPDEYKAFRTELYSVDQAGRELASYTVALAADPSTQPKKQNGRVQTVQGYKDRVLVLFNRGILAEAYWNALLKKLDAKFEAEYNRQLASEEVAKGAKAAEGRKALATNLSGEKVANDLFKGKGSFEDRRSAIVTNHIDAKAFLTEVKNIYENLQDTGMALAQQAKNSMIDLKITSGGGGLNGAKDKEDVELS